MIVLALDSGIERTGYALIKYHNSEVSYQTSGLIKTSSKELHQNRLKEIYETIEKLIQKHKPDAIAMERLFFFKNKKTVIAVSQAQGVVQLLSAQQNIPIHLLAPLQIKQTITGNGVADKKSVKKMLELTCKIPHLSKMIDDEVDAIACGLAYCYLNKKLL
ncbi:MAG: crossover junction endodeoxyribonuclease RuvC [Patescibacteria group bacterium]